MKIISVPFHLINEKKKSYYKYKIVMNNKMSKCGFKVQLII